jgi:predicted NBD/HSP70 family sugar kinase
VDPNGVVCVCGGRGCLAGVASSHALRRAGGMTVMQLLKLADAGDADAVSRLARAGGLVGDVLGGLCTALNPAAIVLGGDLGPALRGAVEARVRESALAPTGEIPVLAATLGDRAGVLGAIKLALLATEWLRDAGFIALTEAA